MDIQPDTRPDIGLDIPESVKSDSNKPKTKGTLWKDKKN